MESSEKFRILIIGERFYPEEFLINDVVDFWLEMGLDVTVLTQYPSYPYGKVFPNYTNRLFGKENYKSAKVFRFKTIEGYRDSKLAKVINYLVFVILGSYKAICLRNTVDKVFVYQTGPLTQAIPAILLRKIFKKKFIIWTWDLWPDTVYSYGIKKTKIKTFFLDKFVSFVYKSADTILISSPGFKDSLLKYAPLKNFEVLSNWIKPIISKPIGSSLNFSVEKLHFLFAGNIGKVQNIENVILGFQIAFKKNPNISFHLVGDGSELNNLKKLVKSRSIPGVYFWGRFTESEMLEFYEKTDFLVISLNPDNVYEKYVPSKFQTYLQTGKPILCAMHGTVSEIIQNEALGITTEPGNPVEIAKAFLEIITFSAFQKEEIKLRSSNIIKSKYNRSVNLKRLTEIVFSKT